MSSMAQTKVMTGQRPMRGEAFTLIEVLLAVAIFAIVISAIHMVFYGALQLQTKSAAQIDEGLPLQQTIGIIKRDLANLVLPGGTFGELQTSRGGNSSTNLLEQLSPVYDSVIGQSSPAFFTSSAPLHEGAPWGDVIRVSYSLAPPTNGTPGRDLIRSVTRNLLPVTQEQPEIQYLMPGLETITFYYYDGWQWREFWDSTVETNKVPRGIKVELQLVAQDNERVRPAPIQVVVPIVVQAGTNQIDQAGQEDATL